jgi:UDPglucose 6-dehydrogenase
MREAPSISIIQALVDAGATVRAYDPEGMEAARAVLDGQVEYMSNAYEVAEGAAAVAIVTEWDAFRALDFARLKQKMAAPVLVDLRNVYQPYEVLRHGFAYSSVGRNA